MVKVRNDLTGKHIDGTKITVIRQFDDYIDPKGQHRSQWLCKCDCGNPNEFVVLGSNLKRGHTTSCGCVYKEKIHEFNDLTGQRFGKLIVLYRTDNKNYESNSSDRIQWHCKCDCGNECDVVGVNLTKTDGPTRSCGCLLIETLKNRHQNATVNSDSLISKKSNWLTSLLLNKNDADKYTVHSNEKTYFVCPDCGEILYKCIDKVYSRRSLSCKCGDGVSYPNKFMYSILKQCGFEILPEHIFDFAKNKKYDIFLPDFNMIIENHGIQHYKQSNRGRSLKEEQENDAYKYKVAIDNKIQHYIILDCRYSEMEWIKNSIMNSELPKLLNFSENDIDWVQADKYATSNLITKAAQMFNNGMSRKEIAKEMNLSYTTIRGYINKAINLGMCNKNT